jgi:hypothetical protein
MFYGKCVKGMRVVAPADSASEMVPEHRKDMAEIWAWLEGVVETKR